MAYNRRNLLERICIIQDITIEHTAKGVKQKWVYDNVIRPQFFISERTFKNYLSINAKHELKELEKAT
jgi:hypothetical protein